jgi:hypothetical protein
MFFKTDRLDADQPISEFIEKLGYVSEPIVDSNLFEEGIKALGAALGFQSHRPDKEVGTGPDNLWIDPTNHLALAFESKAQKTAVSYSKREIAQCHDHIEWLKQNHSTVRLLALLIIGNSTEVDAAATPSGDMVFIANRAIVELSTSWWLRLPRRQQSAGS